MKKLDIHHISEFTGGWFIGNFEPSILKTEDFEVSIKVHPKGEEWDKHTHKVATEYNYVVSGEMLVKIHDEDCYEHFKVGDIFVVPPGFVMEPTFLEDTTVVCIKTPSVKGDKYICD